MPAYHQMGHDTDNLLNDAGLNAFAGAIVSPVNYSEQDVRRRILEKAMPDGFEFVFDPQLYYPKTQRLHLPEWDYFPEEVDSSDVGALDWWVPIIGSLQGVIERLEMPAACSPAAVARPFADDYYTLCVQIGDLFQERVRPLGVRPLQTLIVGLADLSQADRPLEIASIVSQSKCDGIYLVLSGDAPPQRELSESRDLAGAMRLIAALEGADMRTLVGYCSSDVVLFKAAGASSCATGKFFNLRRFTASRFDESEGGGGQLPYYFEEALLSFLREGDFLRVAGVVPRSESSSRNPWTEPISRTIAEGPAAWVRLGWRQFMWWFADIESRFDRGEVDPGALLRLAEANWARLEQADVLMESRYNDGRWIRPWRIALSDFHRQS